MYRVWSMMYRLNHLQRLSGNKSRLLNETFSRLDDQEGRASVLFCMQMWLMGEIYTIFILQL